MKRNWESEKDVNDWWEAWYNDIPECRRRRRKKRGVGEENKDQDGEEEPDRKSES